MPRPADSSARVEEMLLALKKLSPSRIPPAKKNPQKI
jgi:hypothetical protein